jgi:hypothetical protein
MRNFGRVIAGKEFLKPKRWDEWQTGDYIQGEYVGQLDTDKFGKPIIGIKVEGVEDAQIGFEGPNGMKDGIVPLYPNGGLLTQMDKASDGDFVRITYQGKNKIKKGKWSGSMAHAIIVEIDGYQVEDSGESDDMGLDNLLGGE